MPPPRQLILASLSMVGLIGMVALTGCASAADVASTDVAQAGPSSSEPTDTPSAPTTPTKSQAPSTKPPASTSPPPSTSPPTKQQRPVRRLPNVVGGISHFLTPSHNIGCAISAAQARCDIRQHVYREPDRPPDCRGDYGQSIAVTRNGIASFACVTDTVIGGRAQVLPYGTSTVVGEFGCTSRQSGIRCYYLPTKHGFWLSQEQPALF